MDFNGRRPTSDLGTYDYASGVQSHNCLFAFLSDDEIVKHVHHCQISN